MTAAAAAAFAAALTGLAQAQPAAVVTCRVRDDARGRVYRLDREGGKDGPVWSLSMGSAESGEPIRVRLPGAAPQIGPGRATLDYHNANGGRQVSLHAEPGSASLDVYVDYGLEVNVDPNLDPDVDRLNTNGPLTALDCTITP